MSDRITYAQAFADHSRIWEELGVAYDMTGGYVDSKDLKRLLDSPTKTTAKCCLMDQIRYWFQVGPEDGDFSPRTWESVELPRLLAAHPWLAEIAERYGAIDRDGELGGDDA